MKKVIKKGQTPFNDENILWDENEFLVITGLLALHTSPSARRNKPGNVDYLDNRAIFQSILF